MKLDENSGGAGLDPRRRAWLTGVGAFLAGAACGSAPVSASGPRDGDPKPRGGPKSNPEIVIPPALEIGLAPPGIDEYAAAHSPAESDAMLAIAAETRATTEWWIMMIGPVEAGLLRFLIRLGGARRVLEVGTFTGYSAIAMAEALPESGEVVTLDISKEWTDIARRHWDESPHGAKIRLELGDALESIERLDGPFDLVFIDANKDGYIDYWNAVVPKLAPGGIVVADNVLARGRVLDPEARTAAAGFNAYVRQDDRMDALMLPIRDGVTVALRSA